jgi:hypothetical protein
VPTSIVSDIQGVVGLTNTVREQSEVVKPLSGKRAAGSFAASASCETGYVTKAELFAAVNKGISFPYGYGGGPNCSGTSLSSPLWAAVTVDRDSSQGRRTGNINPLLYFWLNTNPSKYFTDITGQGPL